MTAATGVLACGQASPTDTASAGAAAAPTTTATAADTTDTTTGSPASAEPTERTRPTRPSWRDSDEEEAAALDAADGYALTATVPEVVVVDEPGGSETHRLDNPRETGAPLTFLLAEDGGDGWYRVHLPVRPNGTTGWVSAEDVTVASVPYRLEMDVAANELTVYEGDEALRTMPAASGTGDTPTPTGLYYLTELIEPTNAGYGPYAYGTSAFSEVLTSFGGGPGQVGLHGTDDPDSVGRAVSHGCIRLSDEDITFLAELLPLGTPISIA